MPATYIICHYGEIALKGKNRKFFEYTLMRNIKEQLARIKLHSGDDFAIKRISGRILIACKQTSIPKEDITHSLKKVFGITHFSFARHTRQDMNAIAKTCAHALLEETFQTFSIRAKRSDKGFVHTSGDVERFVGAHVVETLNKKVNLTKPDTTCFIELVEGHAFVYTQKIAGPGGLPVGVSGKVVLLLSGGIDSPVAGWRMLKRGAEVLFLHFHSAPYTSRASIDKANDLVDTLSQWGARSALIEVPFADIQKKIMLTCPESLRVLLYRRYMMRIAERIASAEGAGALTTGESLGQVASQTLENIGVVEAATTLPILRPLIGMDKQEIISSAKKIGTYDISILPHEDCCSVFLPRHPETHAALKEIEAAEKPLALGKEITSIIKNISP